MSFNNSKKGVIEVQFNWIFALIAGGMILFFFLTVISYQRDLADQKLGIELGSQLEMIFAGRGVSPGTKQPIDIAEIPITFRCSEGSADYSIINQRVSLGNLAVFSPEVIETKKLLGLTLGFDLPFRTNNLVVLTSPKIKYYFVNFPAYLKDKITDTLTFPSGTEGEVIDFEFVKIDAIGKFISEDSSQDNSREIKYENNPYVKFIFYIPDDTAEIIFDPQLPPDFRDVNDEIVKAIAYKKEGQFEDVGKIIFYKKEEDRLIPEFEDSIFGSFTFNTFIAAVFARDYRSYECGMLRALQRAKNVMDVYEKKFELMREEAEQCSEPNYPGVEWHPPLCCLVMSDAKQKIGGLSSLISEEGIDSSHINEFFDAMNTVVELNRQAMLATCPTIY